MEDNKNLAAIQVIRGIAAILVLLYHASALIKYRLGFDSTSYLWWGYSGVDIFFVLSGFIIYFSSAKNPTLLPWEFFFRRLWRILPVYWVAIGVVLLISSLGQLAHVNADSSTLEKVGQINLMQLAGTIFLIPKSSEIILVAWTLSFEMVFYILFTIFFFKSKKNFFTVMILWAFCSLIAAFLFHANFNETKNPLITLLNPIMIEFLLGCLIGYYYTIIRKNLLLDFCKYAALLSIFGLILFAMNIINHQNWVNIPTNNQYWRFWVFGWPSAIILCFSISLPIKYPNFLVFLGDASYSIYLFHYPIMGIMAKILNYYGIKNINFFGFVTCIIVTVCICSLIYLLIEKPILVIGKKRIRELRDVLQPASEAI